MDTRRVMKQAIISFIVATITLAAMPPKLGVAAPPVVSHLMVPLDLVVEGSPESIRIEGMVHVTAEVHAGLTTDIAATMIQTNLVHTTGMGLNTGNKFPIHGNE